MHMIDWNTYRQQVVAGVGGFAKLSPETVRGYGAMGGAGQKTSQLDAKTRDGRCVARPCRQRPGGPEPQADATADSRTVWPRSLAGAVMSAENKVVSRSTSDNPMDPEPQDTAAPELQDLIWGCKQDHSQEKPQCTPRLSLKQRHLVSRLV
jgi:hypothetical protein